MESTIAHCLIDKIEPVSDVLESDQDLISLEWECEVLALAEASKIKGIPLLGGIGGVASVFEGKGKHKWLIDQ